MIIVGSIVGSVGLLVLGAGIGAGFITLFWRKNPNKQDIVNKEIVDASKKLGL